MFYCDPQQGLLEFLVAEAQQMLFAYYFVFC